METIQVDAEIFLRWPSMADAEELFHIVNSNRAHLEPWLPWVETAQSVENERQWIEMALAAKREGQGWPPLIIYKGAIVGTFGSERIDFSNRKCEIGYWLVESAQGKGIVTRAIRAFLNYAFGPLGLNRVFLMSAPSNKRSLAVAQGLGFTYEGTHRQDIWVSGRFLDHAVYSMLASEWATSPNR